MIKYRTLLTGLIGMSTLLAGALIVRESTYPSLVGGIVAIVGAVAAKSAIEYRAKTNNNTGGYNGYSNVVDTPTPVRRKKSSDRA
jgi:hypothetical protein